VDAFQLLELIAQLKLFRPINMIMVLLNPPQVDPLQLAQDEEFELLTRSHSILNIDVLTKLTHNKSLLCKIFSTIYSLYIYP
jgi:hypothetical protein